LVGGLHIVPAPVTLDIAGPGLLDARNKVTVTARIQGYIKSIRVDRNDPVKVGEVLAELDAEDIVNQLIAARADAEAAKQVVLEARADRDRANAIAAKAKSDLDRKRELAEKGTIAQADWIATEAVFRQTQAELAHAQTTIERTIAQAASEEAKVKVLQVRLSEAIIRSPLDGVVVDRNRNVGDLLSPGTPLVQLVDPTSIIISARFDESAMGTIAPEQTATVHFASLPSVDFKGKVLRVIRQVDQETREFSVDITLDRLPAHWALGQRANVVIGALSPVPLIVIPQSFIARQNGRVGVWIFQNGRADWIPVTLGYPAGNEIQVVTGLHVDDIVLPPADRYSGEPIRSDGRSK
jgi:HlyD family secretion protein